MPRISKRQRLIRDLDRILSERLQSRQLRAILDEENPFSDSVDLATCIALNNALQRHYSFRKAKNRKGNSKACFQTDLAQQDVIPQQDKEVDNVSDNSEEAQPWLNDDEFLQKYRVSRDGFQHLLNLIKDHPVFHTGKRKKQAPVAFQLMVWLKYVGTEGSGASNSNQRNTFGIGYGTAARYRERVTKAFCSLSQEYIYWPDPEEREREYCL
jgi:hypothetical protein